MTRCKGGSCSSESFPPITFEKLRIGACVVTGDMMGRWVQPTRHIGATSVRDTINSDILISRSDPSLQTQKSLSDILIETGNNLKHDEKLREEINDGMVTFLTGFVENQKANISLFISDQVKSWDFNQLTRLIEANIGKDLQYIRFNGMIIGGFVGLFLYFVQHLLV